MTYPVRMYEPLRGSYVSMPDAYGQQVCVFECGFVCVHVCVKNNQS
jgi:hypothetical protein